jgi:hypothetical protein
MASAPIKRPRRGSTTAAVARLLRRKGASGGEEDEGEVEREGAWREGTRYIAGAYDGGGTGAGLLLGSKRSLTSDDTVLLGTPIPIYIFIFCEFPSIPFPASIDNSCSATQIRPPPQIHVSWWA